MKTLFIEFHMKSPLEKDRITLFNGFSTTYNLCENIVSIEIKFKDPEYTLTQLRNTISLYDEIYISCSITEEVFFIYLLSLEYTNKKFIVGGPGAIWINSSYKKDSSLKLNIPNLIITSESLKSVFKNNYENRQWGLNVPEINFNQYKNIVSLLSMSRSCSWGKCKFCEYTTESLNIGNIRPYDFIKNVPDWIIKDKKFSLFVTSPEVSIEEMEYLIPLINHYSKEVFFMMYFRGIKNKDYDKWKRTLSKINDPSKVELFIGIEFLSNRILKYMNKGLTTNEMIKTINLITSMGFTSFLSAISNWNNLIPSDVTEYKKSLDQINDFSSLTIKVAGLSFSVMNKDKFSNCIKDNENLEKIKSPSVEYYISEYKDNRPKLFYESLFYQYKIQDEQQKYLNDCILEDIQTRPFKKIFQTSSRGY